MMMLIAAIASTVVIDGQFDGRVIHAARGTTIVVRLEAQLGTGYSWRIRTLAKNLAAIEPGAEEHAGGDTPSTGGPDVQVFRFRVKSRGKSVLRFVYVRPWEKEKPPAKTFQVTIDSR